jgi:hypothetical protein
LWVVEVEEGAYPTVCREDPVVEPEAENPPHP